jgi:hypothetical protein
MVVLLFSLAITLRVIMRRSLVVILSVIFMMVVMLIYWRMPHVKAMVYVILRYMIMDH